jgi:hypothetical protein
MTHMKILRVIADTVDPRAVIAGGFARDLYLGREPKDMDVWLHTSRDVYAVCSAIERALDDAGIPHSEGKVSCTCMYDKLHNGSLDRMLRTTGLIKFVIDGYDVDVLVYHEPLEESLGNLLLSFDVGLCRAAINANGDTTFHVSFFEDVRNKTLTVDRPTKHAVRLAAKFPDYKMVGPAAPALLAKVETSLVDEAMQLLNDLES